ncbi:MAG: DUF2804 domain-containing protein [Erysipelotrichaceae bacterium]
MTTQKQIMQKGKLLDDKGHLTVSGWAKDLLLQYDRSAIKAKSYRIKEWDYYLVMADDFACAFTISDLSYIGMISVSFLDFKNLKNYTKPIITLLPMGKLNLPATSKTGDVHFKNKDLQLDFIKQDNTRRIICQYQNIGEGKPFYCDITLLEKEMDTMVIVSDWQDKPDHFYYNQKINCLSASGTVDLAGEKYYFDPQKHYGTLDWGRGVWTYDNRWYWSSGNSKINGKDFGFNLGYGFSDRVNGSENALFYDGKLHKLDEVVFNIPQKDGQKDYMAVWTISSNDKRFECEFTPLLDRSDYTKIGPILTDQHQVFGKLNGHAILDDEQVIEIKDMLMFAEDVHNKY